MRSILMVFSLDDTICKDYLQVIDLEFGRVMFNSCSEYSKPMQMFSDSNNLEVIKKEKYV